MKSKDIGIRDEQFSMAMTKNVIDILTIIPRGKISTKGILFVRSILEPNLGAEDLKKWGEILDVFQKLLDVLDGICCNLEHPRR